MTVRAVLVDSIVASDTPPGAIKFYADGEADPAGFHFRCPCGCGGVGRVDVKPGGWTWNGDRERPTVEPSVYFNRSEPGEWHGYLTDGEWRSV